MKTAFSTYILATAVAVAAPADYVNFVRQIQQDTGVEWDVAVGSSGTMLSADGVRDAGALFQLWAIHSTALTEHLLDQKFVSSYAPEASIEISTGDPYDRVARTRVDQPFSVTIGVDGLKTIPANATPDDIAAIPASARKVHLTQGVLDTRTVPIPLTRLRNR